MHSASDLAAWWEKNRQESDKALDDFVDAYPHLWVLAALTSTAMDVGAGTVDLLRFGERAAESYETGKIAPRLQDVLRGVSIAAELGSAAQGARPLLGKLKLYTDPGGEICVPISVGNALRRTGQRFLLSLQEIGEASGVPFRQIWQNGLSDPQMLVVLRRLGATFETIPSAQSMENLTNIARRTDGVVSFKVATPPRIRALTFFTAIPVPSTVNVVPYRDGKTTVPELDAKFKAFKESSKSGPRGGAGGTVVVVAPGDTLSALAARHYGTVEYWPLLWDANRSVVGPNPNRVSPGMRLNVPPLASFTPAQLADARRRFPTWRNY